MVLQEYDPFPAFVCGNILSVIYFTRMLKNDGVCYLHKVIHSQWALSTLRHFVQYITLLFLVFVFCVSFIQKADFVVFFM